MHILVTKDASTKIPREVADLDEARNIASIGFHVELLNDDGSTAPLPTLEQPPVDDAFVAVGSTRFSNGSTQTEDALAEAQASFAAAPAKKAPSVKKSTAKRR